jgi:tetratricopeptide (TPR) repeat protein
MAARDFAAALEALAAAAPRPDDDDMATWLELHAEASYGAGNYEDTITAWERLYAFHHARGEDVEAARAAVMTAIFLLIDAGMLSLVRGWIRRAERLLTAGDLTPIHALIAAVRTYERFFSGDLRAAKELVSDAVELGERFGVMPALAIGRTASGRIAILEGDVEEGLAQLEEVAAMLMSGEVDDLTTGMMFCEIVCAAQALLRLDLAAEWTDAMHRWGVTSAFGGLHGRCRVHRAELLRYSGPCAAAEEVALQACAELRPWMRREYGWPLVELGMARLRRGDLAGAEESFSEARRHCWPPHPGLALARFEQGDVLGAASLIEDAIQHPIDAPSKELPPFGDLRLAPLFDAQSEIAFALGDVAVGEAAAAGLERVAAAYGSPALLASAALARSRVALQAQDPRAALQAAVCALATFVELKSPFDIARCRTVIADAHFADGNSTAAREELEAARAEYAEYGASGRAAAIEARLRDTAAVPNRGGGADTPRTASMRWEKSTCVLEFGGESAQVKDLKGLRYIRRMVGEPGREFHVLDLVAVEAGTLRAAGGETAGIPLLDDASRDAYRRRLADIDEDIEEASRFNDSGRVAKAEADREYLITELSRGLGIGGRPRNTAGSAERARTAVARSLRYALDALAADLPAAAAHLRTSLRTGVYCSYAPDALAGVRWSVE